MINLPIFAFRLDNGENEYIKLQIAEVYGFPDEIAYGGGYGAKGILEIQVGSYKVCANHYFTTGELYNFYCQLQKSYDNIFGEAILQNIERELQLQILFDKTGKVLVLGEFQARPDMRTKLCFELHSDQSVIGIMLKDLKYICQVFGDVNGIINKG
jgi:hypothetical protein